MLNNLTLLCAIEDQTRELIGTRCRHDELYYFNEGAMLHQVSINSATLDFQLWYKRMGHPSEKVVILLPPLGGHKGSLTKACQICFCAKHPINKFTLTDNKVAGIFEKVHCDLWGTYGHISSCGARYFLIIVDDFS